MSTLHQQCNLCQTDSADPSVLQKCVVNRVDQSIKVQCIARPGTVWQQAYKVKYTLTINKTSSAVPAPDSTHKAQRLSA